MKTVLLAMFVSVAVIAAEKPAAPKVAPVAADYNDVFKGLKFREIGPAAMGGRIDDFAVVESNPDIIYVATASGGVFKTTNGGTTWEPVFDDQPNSTHRRRHRRAVRSLHRLGRHRRGEQSPELLLGQRRLQIDRRREDLEAHGARRLDAHRPHRHLPGRSEHRLRRRRRQLCGVRRRSAAFTKRPTAGRRGTTCSSSTRTPAPRDIAMDPDSPGTLIAAMYQRRRTVFGYSGSGPGRGLYKTTDGGATWKKLEKGLPWDPDAKKPAGAAAATAGAPTGARFRGGQGDRPHRRQLLSAQRQHRLCRHRTCERRHLPQRRQGRDVDAGIGDQSARHLLQPDRHRSEQRPALWVHRRADVLLRGRREDVQERTSCRGSTATITPCGSIRATRITCSPAPTAASISSHDRGKTWDYLNNIAIGQFYEIGLRHAEAVHICGGLQDNNVWCGPSATFDTRGISNATGSPSAAATASTRRSIRPIRTSSTPSRRTATCCAAISRRTSRAPSVRRRPEGERFRFQWNSPLVISAFDNKTIYYGGNYLFKSTDRGDSWTRLGNDLTNNQIATSSPIMGRVPDKLTMSRHDGVQDWPAITTISESPLNRDLLWAGTDDGNLQVTRDGGKTWKNVSPKKGIYVSRVVASRFNEGTAYATLDGHRSNDFAVYVFMTSDYGETWKPIRDGTDRRRRRHRPRHPRAFPQSEAAVPRHRARPLRLLRSRRPLDAAQTQSAHGAGGRHRHPSARQRSRPRHPRTFDLDPRRPRAARADDRRHPVRGSARVRYAAGNRVARRQPQRRHRPQGVLRPESSERRAHHLLPEEQAEGEGKGEDHCQRQRRKGHSRHRRHRRCRHQPRDVGPAHAIRERSAARGRSRGGGDFVGAGRRSGGGRRSADSRVRCASSPASTR